MVRPGRRGGVTSRDVARVAGLSQSTVSRVLQGNTNVTPGARAKVLAALEETGYAPNLLARAMKTHSTGTIGVVVSNITNPFYPQMLQALSMAMERADRRLTLFIGDGAGERAALDAIRQRLVDGVVFTTATTSSRPLREAMDHGAPVVLVNRAVEGLPCDQITTDNVDGSAQVADYLMAAGRRRVGLLNGPQEASTAREREAGFVDRWRQLGGEVDPALAVRGDFSYQAGYAAALDMVSRPRPPEVIYSASDSMALGVVNGLRACGVAVPEDMWVVSFDDIEPARWEVFSLTTVRQPMVEMADKAVELLLNRIADPGAPLRAVRLPTHLVVRGSTAHFRV
jgi:LacI family transcriptional regulator